MKVRQGKGEMAAKLVLDSVHKELPIGRLPREILKYLLCCGQLETFYLQFVSKKNG